MPPRRRPDDGLRRGRAGSPPRPTGHYLDQFTYAERATDWRGNNNIAESIFEQMALERFPVPTWIVVGAGTGGTSATIGRYVRYRRHATRLAVVDPEHSAFFAGWRDDDPARDRPAVAHRGHRPAARRAELRARRRRPHDRGARTPRRSRPRARSSRSLGRRVGPSTGTNLWGALRIAREMRRRGRARQHRHAAVRRRRALRRHLLRRRVAGRAGHRHRPVRNSAAPPAQLTLPGYGLLHVDDSTGCGRGVPAHAVGHPRGTALCRARSASTASRHRRRAFCDCFGRVPA